jgi:hypothetical protein
MATDVNQVASPGPPRFPVAPLPTPPPARPAPPRIILPGRREQLTRQAVQAYQANGGLLGPLGVPKGGVVASNSEGRWDLSGGFITTRADGASTIAVTTALKVEYVGIKCWKESKWDLGAGTDEPFVLASLVRQGASMTARFGPYGDMDQGNQQVEPRDMVTDWPPVPTHLHVVVMEHDRGSTGEARRQVAHTMADAAAAASQTASAIDVSQVASGRTTDPLWIDVASGFVSGPTATLLTRSITGILCLGDDYVGLAGQTLFSELDPFTNPPFIGSIGDEPYTHELFVDGGSEGRYDVFFRVRLIDRRPDSPHV